MPYLRKTLENGAVVLLSPFEVVIPIEAAESLDNESLVRVFRELTTDCKFLTDNFESGCWECSTIEQAEERVAEWQRQEKARAIKQELTRKRRADFNSKRARLTLVLIERDGYRCQSPECKSLEDLTIDHIVALSRGGSDELDNLRLMCRLHNSIKGDRNA